MRNHIDFAMDFARWLEQENQRLRGADRHRIQQVQVKLGEMVPATRSVSWLGRTTDASTLDRIEELEQQLRSTQQALQAVSEGAKYISPPPPSRYDGARDHWLVP